MSYREAEISELSQRDSKLKFSVSLTEAKGSVVLHCKGQLRFRAEASLFASTALRVLMDRRDLILDLSGLKSIDSAGLGELVLVQMRARAAECGVRIVAPGKWVRELLELTNVASLFEICASLDEARLSLSREVA